MRTHFEVHRLSTETEAWTWKFKNTVWRPKIYKYIYIYIYINQCEINGKLGDKKPSSSSSEVNICSVRIYKLSFQLLQFYIQFFKSFFSLFKKIYIYIYIL